MRILHVTDVYRPRVGGIEVFVEDLARQQIAAGHEVTVLTPTDGAENGEPRVIRTRGSALSLLAARTGAEVATSGAFDVVHAHLSVVSPFASLVARAADRTGVPVVATVHSMWGGRDVWVRAVRALAGWDSASIIWTAVSAVAAAEVRDCLLPGTEVRVVPNAVDIPWWRAVRPRTGTRPVTLVSTMRLVGRKRPLPLVMMMEEVRRRVPESDLRILIVGDGPQLRRVRDEILIRRLTDRVVLTGRLTRQEIRDLYASADGYVSPAFRESFGIAALEARAAGLPVIAMSSGGVGEFVADGVEGFLCAGDSPMVDTMVAIATDDDLRARISAHNKAVPPTANWQRALVGFDAAYAAARDAGRDLAASSVAFSEHLRNNRRAPVDP